MLKFNSIDEINNFFESISLGDFSKDSSGHIFNGISIHRISDNILHYRKFKQGVTVHKGQVILTH